MKKDKKDKTIQVKISTLEKEKLIEIKQECETISEWVRRKISEDFYNKTSVEKCSVYCFEDKEYYKCCETNNISNACKIAKELSVAIYKGYETVQVIRESDCYRIVYENSEIISEGYDLPLLEADEEYRKLE